jgi:DNA-binding MarR family transcriptional regulator
VKSDDKQDFFLPKLGHADDVTRTWRRERPDLDLADFLLGIYLMRLGRITEQYFGRICEEHFGVRGADMRVLLALRRGGPPFAKRPTDLFQALLVTSGAITKQIDRLVGLDVVERKPDPDYRGGFLVQLTRRGLDMVDAATDILAKTAAITPAMQMLDPKERKAGEQFCFKLLNGLEQVGVPGITKVSSPKAPARGTAKSAKSPKRPKPQARKR